MPATELPRVRPPRPARTQAGATAVEFAVLALLFFTVVFGLVETARLLFVYNTLQEVTRRAAEAAVSAYPREHGVLNAVRQYAVFRTDPGQLIMAPPVTDAHVRLIYLNADLAVVPQGNWPASAAANRLICMLNPRAKTCIRFVQASICDLTDSEDCHAVQSQLMVPLVDLRVPLHRATTIVPVESFGYVPGTPPPLPPVCGCP
nr:TadE/TadG family type IV pilus assembly protein [Massilia oculi]